MAEPQLSGSNGTATAAVEQMSLEQRKLTLTDALSAKVAQGYVVESQTDTEAILISRGRPKKWFGLVAGGVDTRQSMSIDGQGRAIMRSL